MDLERRRGARPKVTGPQMTQTKKEEAKATSTEEHALQVRGTDFYLPLGRPTQDFKKKVLEGPHCDRARESRNLCTDR